VPSRLLAGRAAQRLRQKALPREIGLPHSPPRVHHVAERTSMPHHEPDHSSQSSLHSPVTAGAILLGVFIALSLAVGGLVRLAELVNAADVMDSTSRTGSFDEPSSATSAHSSEPT
jgi:hypothetical protein